VLNGDLRQVRQLLGDGADPNASSSQGEAALSLAAQRPEIGVALIDAGADLARAHRNTINPVWAVGTGRADVVAKVLDAGGDLNCQTAMGTPLHVAAREGKAEILRLLIERGADVNAGNLVGTPLYDALRNGHTECVELLIRAGVALEPPRNAADTLLTRATHHRSTEIVALLLAAGTPVDERGKISEYPPGTQQLVERYANATPLLMAARLGELRIVELLLEAGANPRLRDEDGRYPLDLAREHGHSEVAERLESALKATESDASGNVDEDLLLASERGEVEAIRRLLAQGADVNARDTRSKAKRSTPLLLAARHGHHEAVRALLQAGADVTASDLDEEQSLRQALWMYREVGAEAIRAEGLTLGRTALHEAVARGDAAMAELLLEAGAPADPPDVVGLTPLLLAAQGGHAALVGRLLAAGANPKAADADKSGTVAAAVASGSVECVELLLRAGARIPGGKKTNLLARANAEIVDALVRGGARVDAVDSFGNTALIGAAEGGRLPVVQRLLKLGADVNHRNHHGETALIRGATLGVSVTRYEALRKRNDPLLHRKVELARVLLDAGADINAVSNHGQGALAMAAFTQNEPLVRFLLDRGADPTLGDVAGTPLELARKYHFAPDLVERLGQVAPPPDVEPPAEPEAPGEASAPLEWSPPDLSGALAQAEYRQAVADLEGWCGTRAVAFEHAPGAFYLHVDSRSGFEFETARAQLLARGCTLVWIDPLRRQQVGVFPTADQFDVVSAMGTHAANYDLGPQELVAWLRALHADLPFEITGLHHDVVEGRFLEEIREPRRLAKRMYEFCPDIVDQGTGTVAALALSLEKDRTLYLWWD
jgi:ankyrin repeat protein